MAEVEIAGISVRAFSSMTEAVNSIAPFDGELLHGIAIAVNAEKVMRARKDADLHRRITESAFLYPDGIGAVWAMRRKACATVRIPGVELWEALMARASQIGRSVYLLGAGPGVVDQVEMKLSATYPGCEIVGSHHGYFEDDDEMISKIVRSRPDIVAVALGSPRQEVFMRKAWQTHPECLYIGVGGSFDVFVGRAQRAPKIFRQFGLEWFYRLLRQPSRIGRQILYVQFVIDVLRGRI